MLARSARTSPEDLALGTVSYEYHRQDTPCPGPHSTDLSSIDSCPERGRWSGLRREKRCPFPKRLLLCNSLLRTCVPAVLHTQINAADVEPGSSHPAITNAISNYACRCELSSMMRLSTMGPSLACTAFKVLDHDPINNSPEQESHICRLVPLLA